LCCLIRQRIKVDRAWRFLPKKSTLELKIKDSIRTWTPENSTKVAGKKTVFPFKVQSVPMPGFRAYLQRTLKSPTPEAMDGVIHHVSSMYHTFELIKKDTNVDAVLVDSIMSGTMAEVLSLPVFAPDRGWSSNACTSLMKYVSYLRNKASRERDTDTIADLDLFIDEIQKPWKQRCSTEGTIRGHLKNDKDTLTLANAAPIDMIRKLLQDTMLMLRILELASEKGLLEPSDKLRRVVNKLMVAIVFHGTYAGRPGEWARMLLCDILAMARSQSTKVVAKWHKTLKKYGSLAKWLPAWLSSAVLSMATILKITDETDDRTLLFENYVIPQFDNKKRYLQMDRLLKQWHKDHMNEYAFLPPTMIRKLFHTRIEEIGAQVRGTASAMRGLCLSDGHSEAVALKTYVLNKHNIQVGQAEKTYRAVYGDGFAWPTKEEAVNSGLTVADIMKANTEVIDTVDGDSDGSAEGEPDNRDQDNMVLEQLKSTAQPRSSSTPRQKRNPPSRATLDRHRTAAPTPPPPKATGPKKKKMSASTPMRPTVDLDPETEVETPEKTSAPAAIALPTLPPHWLDVLRFGEKLSNPRCVARWNTVSLASKTQLLHHCTLFGFDQSNDAPTDVKYLGIMRKALREVVDVEITHDWLVLAFEMKRQILAKQQSSSD
jgi:hypothetical protein